MEIYLMIAIVVVGIAAFISGWFSNKKIGQAKIANADKMAEKIIKDAENTAGPSCIAAVGKHVNWQKTLPARKRREEQYESFSYWFWQNGEYYCW